ncbi:MAG: TorF family putative porin [Gallionella sp.]|nr:TorF family putative porin [Gallionella sp.]
MKSKLLSSVILAALAIPGVAMAEETSPHTFSANVGLFSDYIFRGTSQTGAGPALQGGIDYTHASGFYAGVWGSNISWLSDAGVATSASLELDTYFGYRGSFAEDVTFDIGFLRYNYPGTYAVGAIKADTDEIYGSVGYKWVSAKYSYSLGDTFGWANASGSDYLEVNASYPIGDTGFTVGAHLGKQTFNGAAADAMALAGTPLDYTDYKLSVTKDLNGYLLGLAYTDTNANRTAYSNPQGKYLGRSTAILSVTHAF